MMHVHHPEHALALHNYSCMWVLVSVSYISLVTLHGMSQNHKLGHTTRSGGMKGFTPALLPSIGQGIAWSIVEALSTQVYASPRHSMHIQQPDLLRHLGSLL